MLKFPASVVTFTSMSTTPVAVTVKALNTEAPVSKVMFVPVNVIPLAISASLPSATPLTVIAPKPAPKVKLFAFK